MPVKVGGSYVTEAAYNYAASEAKSAKKESGVLNDLKEKFPNLKFTVGTAPFSGNGMDNVSISPKILKQMESNPEKRMEYEALIYDIAHTEVPTTAPGRKVKSHGFIIEDDGGLRSWSISEYGDGNRRSQASAKRSEKKKWWQEILNPQKKKKNSLLEQQRKLVEKQKEKAVEELEAKNLAQKEADERLMQNQLSVKATAFKRNSAAVKEAYLQQSNIVSTDNAFGSVDEFTKFLRANFTTMGNGLASISSKYLKDCLMDEEKRQKLFENLKAADEMLKNHEGEVGFQGMRVIIDEKGEMTVESSKSTITINEGKSQRQIAAAATKGDMQAVLAHLEQDLQAVEDGLKQNKCDAAEVEKAKRLIEQAKQKMASLPDRAPTPEEQTAMSISMLI